MRTQNETYMIELNKLNFLKEDLLFPSQDVAGIIVSSQFLSRPRMVYWRGKRKEKQNLFSVIYITRQLKSIVKVLVKSAGRECTKYSRN